VYTKKIDSVSENHIVKIGRGIGLKFHMPLILALVKARNLLLVFLDMQFNGSGTVISVLNLVFVHLIDFSPQNH
jgi:hypothetical protein